MSLGAAQQTPWLLEWAWIESGRSTLCCGRKAPVSNTRDDAPLLNLLGRPYGAGWVNKETEQQSLITKRSTRKDDDPARPDSDATVQHAQGTVTGPRPMLRRVHTLARLKACELPWVLTAGGARRCRHQARKGVLRTGANDGL